MCDFTTAKHDSGFHSISLFEKLLCAFFPNPIVVYIDFVAHFYFFQFTNFRVFLHLFGLLLKRVTILGIIHNFAHGRIGFVIDKDKI